MSVYENMKTITFGVEGLRDIPVEIRSKIEYMVIDTFKGNDVPVSFGYINGYFRHEGKIYRHKVEVHYIYHGRDGEFYYDWMNFLV
jgi:hypothetical protein